MTSDSSLNDGMISAEQEIIQLSPADAARESAKKARQTSISRFNRLYVYLPIGLVTGMMLGIFGLLIWASLFADGGSVEQGQASGVADVFVTLLCLLPMSLICLALPGAGGFALYWRKTKGSLARKHVSNIAVKANKGIDTADEKLRNAQPRIVDGTIKARQTADSIIDTIYNAATSAVAKLDTLITRKDDEE